jgi:hypothetical protein
MVVSVTDKKITIRFRGGNTTSLYGNYAKLFPVGTKIWACCDKVTKEVICLSDSPEFPTTPPNCDTPLCHPACDGWCGFFNSGVKWLWGDEDDSQP